MGTRRRFEITARQTAGKPSTKGWNVPKKLQKVKVGDISKLTGAENRPGEWRKMLTDGHTPDVPAVIEDKIVDRVADGIPPDELEDELGLTRGAVKRVLVRKFGGVEQMKRALELQSYENAIIFNEVAMKKSSEMSAAQAAVAAKVSVDAGLALGKSRTNKSQTIDFDALSRLGETLERMEKRLTSAEVREI